MCVLIYIVYVPTGRGRWTRWSILKVTSDCTWLLNTGDMFFNLWKEMRLFLGPKILNRFLQRNEFMKFMLMPVLGKEIDHPLNNVEQFERTTAALRVMVSCQLTFRLFWHIDWHRFLLKFTHKDGRRQGGATVSFFQGTPYKKVTYIQLSQGYRLRPHWLCGNFIWCSITYLFNMAYTKSWGFEKNMLGLI